MRAILFEDVGKVAFGEYPHPKIENDDDAIVRVSTAAICGSDLHVLRGLLPGMRPGSVLGHEYVGEIVETGSAVSRFKVGDRVVGSFPIICGACWYCARGDGTNCENLRILGYGMFVGDLDGAQAEYVRIPVAGVNLHAVDPALSDEQAIFAGDIMSTGLYIVDRAEIHEGDVVAVIGAGPVGLFTTMFALLQQPSRVYVVDVAQDRLKLAESLGAIPMDASKVNPVVELQRLTGDRGADVVIDCVGGEPKPFDLALDAVRPGGTVAVIGVYTTLEHPFALGNVWRKNVKIVMGGSANVQGTWTRALDAVREGRIDPTVIITHTLPLDEGVNGYDMFERREALKVLLKP
jgi:2-desacetyl-2-hydroxyethyl bacteriochlorophyllide A dehydrogenase